MALEANKTLAEARIVTHPASGGILSNPGRVAIYVLALVRHFSTFSIMEVYLSNFQ